MPITRRPGVRLAVIAALLSVSVLAPGKVVAASCTGNSHTMTLSDGTASPDRGTTSTDFTFTVLYTDNGGCAPDEIVVAIPGVGRFALAPRKGDLETGATFGRQMNLPVGTWSYRFEAASGSGAGERTDTLTKVDPNEVRVAAPPPRETPKPPSPTPKPPSPTPKPTRTPAPATSEPSRATETDPGHTTRPTGPDRTSSGHDGRTQAPAAVLGRSGRLPPDDLDGPAAGGAAGAPRDQIPRPVMALAVSIASTLLGLVLYALLQTRLLVPAPRRRVEAERDSSRTWTR